MKIDKAQAMAAAIIRDIKSRRGIGDEWDAIDDDTQEEIKAAWATVLYEIANDL